MQPAVDTSARVPNPRSQAKGSGLTIANEKVHQDISSLNRSIEAEKKRIEISSSRPQLPSPQTAARWASLTSPGAAAASPPERTSYTKWSSTRRTR